MGNFKTKLFRKITDNRIIRHMGQENMYDFALILLANAPQEIEKINYYLDSLDLKSKKESLTHLEKIEKRYLLSVKREVEKYKPK